ncbi:MAG TPA: galactose oxidase early set domain-containing protein, partial [Streptosporangiaceae bacterium]
MPSVFYPKLLVFGGKRSPGVWAGTDTVFVLQLWNNTWHPLALGGARPVPRYRHASVIDRVLGPGESRVRMFLNGGAASNGALLNDTWTLSRSQGDSAYASWSWSADPASAGLPATYKHSMIHDEQWNRLTLFGGDRTYEGTGGESNSGGESNETWVRATDVFVPDTTWKRLVTDAPILRRSGHSAVYMWNKSVNARVPERYNPLAATGQRWTSLEGSPKFDRQTFPLMFGLPDGRLFYAGRNDTSAMLPATLTGVWADKKLAAPSAATLTAATGVQYLPGRVLKLGGRPDLTAAAAERAEFAGGSHQWIVASTTNLKARGNPNATMLPNGQVLVTGGRQAELGQDGSNGSVGVHTPQAWTPYPVNSWTSGSTQLSDEPVNRGYHSTAILLPDARVLSAGGEEGPSSALDDAYLHGTIFEPPYLFDPASPGGNSYIARPSIDASPALIAHGCPFQLTVTATGGVSSMCLIRPGAVTHAFNQDQHFVPLSFTQSGSVVTADGPADAYTAPPGDYMLFVLDNTTRKVPSVARWVRVTESMGPYQAADAVRPGRVLNLNGSSGLDGPGCAQPVHVTWTSPSDDSNFTASGRARALDLRYSTSTICDNCWTAFASATQVDCEPPAATPGQTQALDVAGLGIGSYHFRLVSRDDQSATGNYSGLSNGKSVSVFGCEEAFSGGGGGGGGSLSARSTSSPTALAATPGTGAENSLRLPS